VFMDNSVGGYTPATEDLYFTVYWTNGDVTGPTEVTAGMLSAVTTGVAAGGSKFTIQDSGDRQIDAIQLTMGNGKVKIPVISFTVEDVANPQPLDLNFTATLYDNDGDFHQDTFSINLDPVL
jgi:hypothetical protein